jgi:hypothetical protein
MVLGGGDGSIYQSPLLADFNANNKNGPAALESALAAEDCSELFDTLAQWNEYLERHAPFSLRLSVEERVYLEGLAGNQALGAYMREELLGDMAESQARN